MRILGTDKDPIMFEPLSYFSGYGEYDLLGIVADRNALIDYHDHLSEDEFKLALQKYSDVITYLRTKLNGGLI